MERESVSNPFVTATISDLTGSFFVDVINPSLFKENGSCYLDKGQSYAGKINVTKSGKTCVHWNEIPYINNSKFVTLEKKTIVGIRKAMVQSRGAISTEGIEHGIIVK